MHNDKNNNYCFYVIQSLIMISNRIVLKMEYFMKKYTIIQYTIFLCSIALIMQTIAIQQPSTNIKSSLNAFGISTIIPADDLSSDQRNQVISQRIADELGENFTLQDIFIFLDNIQKYYDNLVNTQNLNETNLTLAKLALADAKKAKMSPYIKSNMVTPEDEHNLRIRIGKLNRQISPHN